MTQTVMQQEPATVLPFRATSHEWSYTINGQPFRLRVWTAREWEQTPERDRPEGATRSPDGFGWSLIEPVAAAN